MFEGIYRSSKRVSSYEAEALRKQAETLQQALLRRPNKLLPSKEEPEIKVPFTFEDKLEALRERGIGCRSRTWRDHVPTVTGEALPAMRPPTPRRHKTQTIIVVVERRLCADCAKLGYQRLSCPNDSYWQVHHLRCIEASKHVHVYESRVRNGRPIGEERREAQALRPEIERRSERSTYKDGTGRARSNKEYLNDCRTSPRNHGRKPRQAYRPVLMTGYGS